MNGFFWWNPHSNTFDLDIACDTSKWKENWWCVSMHIEPKQIPLNPFDPKPKLWHLLSVEYSAVFTAEIYLSVCQFVLYTKNQNNNRQQKGKSTKWLYLCNRWVLCVPSDECFQWISDEYNTYTILSIELSYQASRLCNTRRDSHTSV